MNANTDLLLRGEVYQIVGCAMDLMNAIGHGFHEKPYENALVVEFRMKSIPYIQQPRYPILYKGVTVGEYISDLITHGAVIVDTKVIDAITDHERGQMLNYLRISGLQVGLILNFKHPKLQWERIVLDRKRQSELLSNHPQIGL
jgi:GxxExxY protein